MTNEKRYEDLINNTLKEIDRLLIEKRAGLYEPTDKVLKYLYDFILDDLNKLKKEQ